MWSAPSTTWWFVRMSPFAFTITPDPSARSTADPSLRGAFGWRPPKSMPKKGSLENGNCCGARTRRAERIVTTAGETRSTTSAYDSGAPALEGGVLASAAPATRSLNDAFDASGVFGRLQAVTIVIAATNATVRVIRRRIMTSSTDGRASTGPSQAQTNRRGAGAAARKNCQAG